MQAAVSYSFSPTTTIYSSQVNQNFSDLINYINNTACVTSMVTMWSGAIGSVPTGWRLCNGSNGTPDLRDKFIMGAGNTYAIGASGGEDVHVLTSNEMPIHSHSDAGHTHTHATQVLGRTAGGSQNTQTSGSYAISDATTTNTGYANIQNTGGGVAHNNIPPFYALAFIQKD